MAVSLRARSGDAQAVPARPPARDGARRGRAGYGFVCAYFVLLLLFGVSVSLQAAWTLFGTLLYTANKHHLQCYVYFAATIVALLVARLTIGHLGFGAVPVIMICTDVFVLITSISLCVHYLRDVKFISLFLLFNPFFYWNKIKWVVTKTKGEGFYFWSPNR